MELKNIITLSVETATRNSSLAVLRGDKVLAEWRGGDHFVQSESLLIEIENLLNEAKVVFDDVNLFAAVIGPGSFSGLRIGLATIKGFAMARKIPSIGVSTLETCAAANDENGLNFVILSAGRGNVFAQAFEINIKNGEIKAVNEPQHISLEDAARQINETASKNKIVQVIAANDVQNEIANLLGAQTTEIKISSPASNLATASGKIAAQCFANKSNFINNLQPLYLRPVDIGKPKTT